MFTSPFYLKIYLRGKRWEALNHWILADKATLDFDPGMLNAEA